MNREATRLAIVGAVGRMGRELCRAALETDGVELAGGIVEPGAPELGSDLGGLCGWGHAGVSATEEPPEDAEALIEFTSPEATVEHLSYHKPLVIGTTGLSEEQRTRVEEAAQSVPVVLAPNMSVGVNLLREVVRELSEKLGDGYDIEVAETHHQNKVDAPSGTALFWERPPPKVGARASKRWRSTDVRDINQGKRVRSGFMRCAAGPSLASIASSSTPRVRKSR